MNNRLLGFFRKKKDIIPKKLQQLRVWQDENIPIDYTIKSDVIEPFQVLSVFSLEQMQANPEKFGGHLFGDDPSPEAPKEKLTFFRILKRDDLIQSLKKCLFCNGDSEIILIHEKTEYSIIVCCNAHMYDAYSTIMNTTYGEAKMYVDAAIREAAKKDMK